MASHDDRETYDPQALKSRVRTQNDPNRSVGVQATGTGSAEWHPARGAGANDWLDEAHAYATRANAARVGTSDIPASGAGLREAVTSDAPNIATGLLEDVTKRVMATDYIDASRVHVAVQGDQVVLTGSVANERAREQIEQLVAGCDGVKRIDNQLHVERVAGDR